MRVVSMKSICPIQRKTPKRHWRQSARRAGKLSEISARRRRFNGARARSAVANGRSEGIKGETAAFRCSNCTEQSIVCAPIEPQGKTTYPAFPAAVRPVAEPAQGPVKDILAA